MSSPATLTTPPYQVDTTEDATTFLLPPRKRSPAAVAVAILYLLIVLTITTAAIAAFRTWSWHIFTAFKLELLLGAFVFTLLKGAWQRLSTRHDTLVLNTRTGLLINLGPRSHASIELPKIARLELELPQSLLVHLGFRRTCLLAEHFDGKRTLLVADYPPELLRRLAADIAPALRNARAASPDDQPPAWQPAEKIADVSAIPLIARDVLEMPVMCAVRYIPADNLHTFLLPRWGFVRTAFGLIAFCLCMSLFLFFFTMLLIGGLQDLGPNPPPFKLWLIAIAATLILVDLCGILAAFHLYSRKTIIVVATPDSGPPELSWMTKGFLGTRERHWSRDDLRAITTAKRSSSNSFKISNSDETPIGLIVLPHRGRKRVLADGKELDMRWLATRLRHLLNLPRD